MNLEDIYERKILAEKNLYYNIPKNKKSLKLDFYLLTLLSINFLKHIFVRLSYQVATKSGI